VNMPCEARTPSFSFPALSRLSLFQRTCCSRRPVVSFCSILINKGGEGGCWSLAQPSGWMTTCCWRPHVKVFNILDYILRALFMWLQIRLCDLEKMLDIERQCHAEERAPLEAELQEFWDYKEENGSQIEVWHIMKWSKMARLNIHPMQSSCIHITPWTPVKKTLVRGVKRKHTTLKESEKSSTFKSLAMEKLRLLRCYLNKIKSNYIANTIS
jgi:hypothetical protein